MKLSVEEMCATLTEVFGCAVVFGALGGLVTFFHDFGDNFISYFLG